MESFYNTLKVEHIYQTRYETRPQARLGIIDWIEGDYDRQRVHASIDYLPSSITKPCASLHAKAREGRSRLESFRNHASLELQLVCANGCVALYPTWLRRLRQSQRAHHAADSGEWRTDRREPLTLGHLLTVDITPANAQVQALPPEIQRVVGQTVKLVLADQGYTG